MVIDPISLIVVRHMEAAQDGPDPSLSERGRLQLKELTATLDRFPISFVYSSDLQRSIEPAQAIAEHFGVPHETIPELKELSKDGNPFFKPASTKVQTAGAREAEGEKDFDQRVVKAIDYIVARHPNSHVALVTHSGTIRVIVRHLLALPLDAFELASVPPGGFIILTRDSGGNWQSKG